MLAGPRCAASRPKASAVDLGEPRRRVGLDPGRELCARDRATDSIVLGPQHIGGLEHGRDRHSPRLSLEGQLVFAALAEVLVEDRVQALGRERPAADRLELGVLKLFGLAEPRPHRVPLARRQQDDAHVAVATAEDRVGTGCGAIAGRLVACDLCRADDPHRWVDHLCRGLVQREVDVIAVPALEPVPVRHERRPRRLHRRHLECQVPGRHQRLTTGQPGPAEDSAHRQQCPVGGDPVAVWTGLPEVGDREHDQVGVSGANEIDGEPEL